MVGLYRFRHGADIAQFGPELHHVRAVPFVPGEHVGVTQRFKPVKRILKGHS